MGRSVPHRRRGPEVLASRVREASPARVAKAVRLNELVDGDVKVSNQQSFDRGAKRVIRERLRKTPRNVHTVVEGTYVQNRSGHQICREFQSENCEATASTRVHQLALCLSPAHGAEHPHPCHLVPRKTTAASRAECFGKGRGKGKKGRKWQLLASPTSRVDAD